MRQRNDTGDTLVEILFAVVIIGIIVSAFFATMSTSASASKTHRDFVTADAVLRDYAESAKQAARNTCTAGNVGSSFAVSYTPPAGTGVTVAATGRTCPAVSGPTGVSPVVITATLPSGATRVLTIEVRTP